MTATNIRPQHSPTLQDAAAQPAVVGEANRLRALLERTGDAIDLALDSDWRVAIDILLDLSDEIRAEFLP